MHSTRACKQKHLRHNRSILRDDNPDEVKLLPITVLPKGEGLALCHDLSNGLTARSVDAVYIFQ